MVRTVVGMWGLAPPGWGSTPAPHSTSLSAALTTHLLVLALAQKRSQLTTELNGSRFALLLTDNLQAVRYSAVYVSLRCSAIATTTPLLTSRSQFILTG
jgi:hypothetical protein